MAETSLYMFWFRCIAEMFPVLSAIVLFGRAFVCFVLVWLFIIWPFIWVSEFNEPKLNGNGNEYNRCESVRCNSLFISSPLLTKVHPEVTTWNSHVLDIWEKVNYTTTIFLKFLFRNLTLFYIFCLGYLWQTNWMNLNSREIRRLNIKLSFNEIVAVAA